MVIDYIIGKCVMSNFEYLPTADINSSTTTLICDCDRCDRQVAVCNCLNCKDKLCDAHMQASEYFPNHQVYICYKNNAFLTQNVFDSNKKWRQLSTKKKQIKKKILRQ